MDENGTSRKLLKKSVSTAGLGSYNATNALKEVKSFTGALDELKDSPSKAKLCTFQQENHNHLYSNEKTQTNEKGIETREVISNQIFFFKEEMLLYRGKRYSLSDIAIRWKKDCRTWLWKSKLNKKKNKSLIELREKLQSTKFFN